MRKHLFINARVYVAARVVFVYNNVALLLWYYALKN